MSETNQPKPLSPDAEADIRARRAGITPGVWKWVWNEQYPDISHAYALTTSDEWVIAAEAHNYFCIGNEDACFIAAAPSDIDALLAALDAERARAAALQAERDELLMLANGLDAALEDAGITDVIAQIRLSALRAKLAQGDAEGEGEHHDDA